MLTHWRAARRRIRQPAPFAAESCHSATLNSVALGIAILGASPRPMPAR
jgi:hypothetical protein